MQITNVSNIDILSKLLVTFGSISVFLLSLIVYFLKRLVSEHDTIKDTVNRHEVKLENHEQRIKNLEE